MKRGPVTHGMSSSPIYSCWKNMRYRVSRSPRYANVNCDPRWVTFQGFLDNQPTTGRPYAPGLVLARFGDTGDYSPENTRWATKSENAQEMIAARTPEQQARFQAAAHTKEANARRGAAPKRKTPCPVCGVLATGQHLARWHKHEEVPA